MKREDGERGSQKGPRSERTNVAEVKALFGGQLHRTRMAEAGRVRHHLNNHGGDPINLILFVGFCAEHTLGAQILSGKNPVNIHGEPKTIRAQVARIDAFSGHAGHSELLAYFRRISGDIKKITVVHGDEIPAVTFGEVLKKERPQAEVIVPVQGQIVEF